MISASHQYTGWLMGLKDKIDDSPEEIAKFWKFVRKKIFQIKDKNLQLAIKDDLENKINKYRLKKRKLKAIIILTYWIVRGRIVLIKYSFKKKRQVMKNIKSKSLKALTNFLRIKVF